MAGGAERSAAFRRAGAAQGEAAAEKQARPQEQASRPASAARQRLGAARGWRCAAGAVLGRGGLRRGVLRSAEPGGRSRSGARGSGLRRPSGQGHLQASQAARIESFSAAPRRRAPAIWRHWEPRHPRVCPSPGGAPALARGRRRAKGGLRAGEPGHRWAGAQGVLDLPPALVADATLWWRLFFSAPPRPGAPSVGRGGRGAARGRPDSLQGPGGGAQPSSAEPSRAKPRRVTPSPPAPSPARRPCARPPPSPPPLRPGSPPSPSPQLLPLQPLGHRRARDP